MVWVCGTAVGSRCGGLLFVEGVAEEGEFLEGEGLSASLGVDVEGVEKGVDGFDGDVRKAGA